MEESSKNPVPASSRCNWINIKEDKTIEIRCCFKDCYQDFVTFSEFREHFLESHFSDSRLPRSSDGASWFCDVIGCQMYISDLCFYDRHLLFHCYHAELAYKGAFNLIRDPRVVGKACKNSGELSNNVYYGGEFLRCFWNDCSDGCDTVEQFFKHVRSHVEEFAEVEGNFDCQWRDCSATFGGRKHLISHLKHHTGEKHVACPYCGAFFANLTKFFDHVIRQNVSDSSNLKCFLCNKIFSTQRLLREHSRRHINTHKCPFCDMTSNGPHNLRLHIADRHSKKKTHECTICSSAFKRQSDLQRHFAKHSSRDQFPCEFCEATFSWKSALTAHQRIHKQAPEYVCHLCPDPKRYTRGASLSIHFSQVHKLVLPSGHCRFMYKKCADGCYRLQTERYESAGLTNDQETVAVQKYVIELPRPSSVA